MGKIAIWTYYTQQPLCSKQAWAHEDFKKPNVSDFNLPLIHFDPEDLTLFYWYTCDAGTAELLFFGGLKTAVVRMCPPFAKVQKHPAAYSVKGLLLCENPWFMTVQENILMIMEMLNKTLLWEGCCYPDAAVPELCPSHTLNAWCQEILAKGRV